LATGSPAAAATKATAAGPAAVGEEVVRPRERRVGGAQGAGRAGQLLHRLAFEAKRDEHGGDARRLQTAFDQSAEQGLRIGFAERFAAIEAGERRVGVGAGLRRFGHDSGEIVGTVHEGDPSEMRARKSPPGAAG
jgi:hypothetical protein